MQEEGYQHTCLSYKKHRHLHLSYKKRRTYLKVSCFQDRKNWKMRMQNEKQKISSRNRFNCKINERKCLNHYKFWQNKRNLFSWRKNIS